METVPACRIYPGLLAGVGLAFAIELLERSDPAHPDDVMRHLKARCWAPICHTAEDDGDIEAVELSQCGTVRPLIRS